MCFINAHDIILVLCVVVKNCIEKPYHIFCSGFSLFYSAEKKWQTMFKLISFCLLNRFGPMPFAVMFMKTTHIPQGFDPKSWQ